MEPAKAGRADAKPLVSLVVPACNEAEALPALARRLLAVLAGEDVDLELIIVDDGSVDATSAVVGNLHAEDSRVKLLGLSRRFGPQAAFVAGLDASSGDLAITIDGDLWQAPEVLPRLIAAWREGHDVVHVVPERSARPRPWSRAASRLLGWVLRTLTGVPLVLGAGDSRLMDRDVIAAVCRLRERARSLRGLMAWVGFESTSIRFTLAPHVGRGPGQWARARIALGPIASFSTRPLHLVAAVGAALSAVAVLYALYVIWVALVLRTALHGWTSVVLLNAIVGAIQFLVLGVLAFYIAKLYEEAKRRPPYLIRETVGLPPDVLSRGAADAKCRAPTPGHSKHPTGQR